MAMTQAANDTTPRRWQLTRVNLLFDFCGREIFVGRAPSNPPRFYARRTAGIEIAAGRWEVIVSRPLG